MLNLDQVRLLENRVERAVTKIQSLTAENTHVRSQLSILQTRVNELEGLVRAFKDDQGRIEEGILNALDRLSAFEDSVYQSSENANGIRSSPSAQKEPDDSAAELISEENTALPVSESIQINAEWQNPVVENRDSPPSSDGQMDIF